MKCTRTGLFLGLASALLSGCASTVSPTQMLGARQIEPHQNVSHGASELQAHYALGKYHLGAGRAALAREEFLRALSLDRNNAEVRNGLASAYVQLADVDQALEHLSFAVVQSPDASHLQSNLGYALLLKGRYDESAEALHRAMTLDPENNKARQNWLVLQGKVKGGTSEQSESLSLSPVRSPLIVAPFEKRLPSPAITSQSSQVINIDFDRPVARPTYTVSFGPGDTLAPVALAIPSPVLPTPGAPDRQDPGAPSRQAPAFPPRATPSSGAALASVRKEGDLAVRRVSLHPNAAGARVAGPPSGQAVGRIEISNGNGVGRMATRVKARLRELDVVVSRVSNADRFNYPATRIFFREGHAAEAKALSLMLPVRAELVPIPASQISAWIDVRLVIGADFVAPNQIEQINPLPLAPVAAENDILTG